MLVMVPNAGSLAMWQPLTPWGLKRKEDVEEEEMWRKAGMWARTSLVGVSIAISTEGSRLTRFDQLSGSVPLAYAHPDSSPTTPILVLFLNVHLQAPKVPSRRRARGETCTNSPARTRSTHFDRKVCILDGFFCPKDVSLDLHILDRAQHLYVVLHGLAHILDHLEQKARLRAAG